MRLAASILAILAAVSVWLSAGTLALSSGDTDTTRIAALPSIWILLGLVLAALIAARVTKLRLAEACPLAISLILWLPFLPGRIPAAFLIWQGPIEAIVWLLAVAGLIAARRPLLPASFTDPMRAPWIAALLLGASAVIVFTQVPDVIPGGDEPHYLAATQSLIGDFDLRVANNYAAGDYLQYFPGRLEPHFLQRAASGEIYSIHAPGVSVIVLPAFAIAGYPGAVITMILIAALTTALTWRLAWRVSGSAAGAWIGVCAVFATAPYFFHTFTIYPEIIGGFCVMCGVWLLFELADGHSVSARWLAAVGAALAMLPWLHSRFAVLAGVMGVILVARLALRPAAAIRIAQFLAIPVVAGAAWLAYFWLIWGSANPIAPYGADTSTSPTYILRGLIGLLLDQQFGVIATAPAYVIALVGALAFARQRPRIAFELLFLVTAYAMTTASYAMWWAGSAAPARFLVAVLPVAALPIAALLGAPKKGGASTRPSLGMPALSGSIVLLLISMALVIPRAFVENGRFIYNNRGSFDATAAWLTGMVDLPAVLPSVHLSGGSVAVRDAAVWLIAFAAASLMTYAIARRRSMPVSITISGGALAGAVMLSASVVSAYHGAAFVAPDRSKLAALSAFRPAWHSTLADLTSWRRMPAAEFLSAMSIEVTASAVRINRVPAGEYEMLLTPPVASDAALTMFVGRSDPPIEVPPQNGEPTMPFRLRVPVALLSLNLVTKIAGGPSSLTLRPLDVAMPPTRRYATRAIKSGEARVFVFDDHAYPERDGFWTRANERATVVIDKPESGPSGLPISITAGAVPTTITIGVDGWQQSFSLGASERQNVTLPPSSSGTWHLDIRSGAGFRPSERDPSNRDVRLLAAWIAVR